MTDRREQGPDADDVEALLPWLASGRLDLEDAQRVRTRLGADAELMRRFALVEDERAATVALNEALGAPSAAATRRLFDGIDAEPARPAPGGGARWSSLRLRDLLGRRPPGALTWGAAAAALIIAVQAGFIATLVTDHARAPSFQTASGPQTAAGTGSFALVGFAPTATAADITALLQGLKASIAEGPRAGLYRVRLSDEPLARDALEAAVKTLRDAKTIVRFAAPAP